MKAFLISSCFPSRFVSKVDSVSFSATAWSHLEMRVSFVPAIKRKGLYLRVLISLEKFSSLFPNVSSTDMIGCRETSCFSEQEHFAIHSREEREKFSALHSQEKQRLWKNSSVSLRQLRTFSSNSKKNELKKWKEHAWKKKTNIFLCVYSLCVEFTFPVNFAILCKAFLSRTPPWSIASKGCSCRCRRSLTILCGSHSWGARKMMVSW